MSYARTVVCVPCVSFANSFFYFFEAKILGRRENRSALGFLKSFFCSLPAELSNAWVTWDPLSLFIQMYNMGNFTSYGVIKLTLTCHIS